MYFCIGMSKPTGLEVLLQVKWKKKKNRGQIYLPPGTTKIPGKIYETTFSRYETLANTEQWFLRGGSIWGEPYNCP